MEIDSIVDVIRLANALCAGVVFVALVFYVRVYWNTYGTQRKLMFSTYVAYALVAAYGSYESFWQNAPFGARTILLFLASLPALYAIFRYRGNPIE